LARDGAEFVTPEELNLKELNLTSGEPFTPAPWVLPTDFALKRRRADALWMALSETERFEQIREVRIRLSAKIARGGKRTRARRAIGSVRRLRPLGREVERRS
jgi:hypothetical protein